MVAQVPKSQAPKGLKPGSVVQLTNGMQVRLGWGGAAWDWVAHAAYREFCRVLLPGAAAPPPPTLLLRGTPPVQAVVTAVDEESVSIDANHPLAGKQLSFEVQLTRHIPAAQLEYATFGAGCFWSVELVFQRVPGVLQTAVGYSQGRTPSPTYEDVSPTENSAACSGGREGHALLLCCRQLEQQGVQLASRDWLPCAVRSCARLDGLQGWASTGCVHAVCICRCARATRGTTRWCSLCTTPQRCARCRCLLLSCLAPCLFRPRGSTMQCTNRLLSAWPPAGVL